MDMSFEEQVRERAYHIWLAGGMADGHAHEHWTMAEQAVKASEPVVIITKPARPAPKAKPVAKAKAAKSGVAKAAKPVSRSKAAATATAH